MKKDQGFLIGKWQEEGGDLSGIGQQVEANGKKKNTFPSHGQNNPLNVCDKIKGDHF